MLRFITCGSVDDGKSTLIGRLLYESKLVFEDHLAALQADSKKVGTQGGDLDFALLVDGLAAEREQGITIDVAYRFFSTERRKFIVADTPGHEQYTRNMVTGASTAELARDPGRRPQGRADPDPAAQLLGLAPGHPSRGTGGQQARPRRVRRGGLRPRGGGLQGLRLRARYRRRRVHPALGSPGGQHHRRAARTRPGTAGPRCSRTSRPSRSSATEGQARSGCRCSG